MREQGRTGDGSDPRRSLPRTDQLLADARLAELRCRLGEQLVKDAVRWAQAWVQSGELPTGDVISAVLDGLPATASSLRPVLNATGVVLHTNLGRAPLSPAAVDALAAAAGYVDVEFDLSAGVWARRGRGARRGASAGAGSHRARPRQRDYRQPRRADRYRQRVPHPRPARQHWCLAARGWHHQPHAPDRLCQCRRRANWLHTKGSSVKLRRQRFTSSVPVRELAGLCLPVIGDIGSGLLEPDSVLPGELDAGTWLREGAALVTASGDKLLGGPQADIVLGSADLAARLRRHTLQRAQRVDKLTTAALEATVVGPSAPPRLALPADPGSLREQAERLAD